MNTVDNLFSISSDARKVLFGLVCVVAIGWIYLLAGAGVGMDQVHMGGGEMTLMRPAWTPGHAALVFVMWAIMMVAIMLPSAAPTILQVAGLAHRRPGRARGVPRALFFTAGYLMVWTGFSFAATLLQWALDSAHLLSETMAIRSGVFAGLLVIAVALYQLTPLKQTSLRRCRASVGCLAEDQRGDVRGIVWQGMRYGVSCLGCCSGLMCLAFVGGLMNVAWMVIIALWVLAEKTLPWGSRMARLTAAGLVAWGSISLAIAAF